ncbi:MAG: acetyl-CoA carboxylase biotin carboxyl carrier protein [Thermoflexaceae bacterium]|nr:acetyl-CoA carboxylase biotin carboxyl carrier protein [Thermoflexaceae bacterium]
MNIEEVYKLMGKFEGSLLTEMELEMEGVKISLKKGLSDMRGISGVSHADTAVVLTDNAGKTKTVQKKEEIKTESQDAVLVKAPLVGTFYRAASPEEKPFVMVGQKVKKGDVVGIIEAMKLMNEITAPQDGIIEAIETEDGSMVEYDEVLMRIKQSN